MYTFGGFFLHVYRVLCRRFRRFVAHDLQSPTVGLLAHVFFYPESVTLPIFLTWVSKFKARGSAVCGFGPLRGFKEGVSAGWWTSRDALG